MTINNINVNIDINNSTLNSMTFSKDTDITNSDFSIEDKIYFNNDNYGNTVFDKTINISNNSDLMDQFFLELEKEIINMANDITAKNMHELMTKKYSIPNEITHIITIKPDTDPIKQKTRGVPESFRAELKKTLIEMKEAGMIVDSKSPWCSPIRLVKKSDGSIRICVDFRKVNNETVKDSYPMPKIEDIFNRVAKAKIYSTIDLAQGYHQVSMDKNSRPMTAFSTSWGFWEYTVMPMGLTNACATFQRVMNHALEGLDEICCAYLDDIIIFSEDVESHLKHVELIIDRLRKNNLKIKLSKCKFARRRIEYLSHIIENGTITPNNLKIQAVSKALRPKTVKQVQAFLGLTSYYRRFIKNYANIASPLINLTRKGVPFLWTIECETAFETLKMYLTSEEHVLALPQFDREFRIEADASKFGLGGVLSQSKDNKKDKNGKITKSFRPIAYFSKHLSKTESNYSASERELLAIVLSVEHFKQYLYGRHFTILTDHEPLKFLTVTDVPAPRLARLLRRLNIYNYTIEYRAGKQNGNADALSRMMPDDDFPLDVETDDTVFINAMHLNDNKVNMDQIKDDNLNWIISLLKRNKEKPKIEVFDTPEKRSLYKQWNRLKFFNNSLFREYSDENDKTFYQYIVPKVDREFILANSHDTAVCGHLGFHKTNDRIINKFYWYKQADDIKKYVNECVECQKLKTLNKKYKAEMQPIFATRPNQIVTTDLMGPLPLSYGKFKHILVIVDHFTKYVEFLPLETASAQETAKRMIEYICRHGVPESILSDRGTNYQSQLISEIWELLDIRRLRTTSYWPQCNGQTERMNKTLQIMIANYVNEKKNDWAEYLPLLQFAYNSAVQTTTKFTPFELTYGRPPRMPLDLLTHQAQLDLYLSAGSYAENLQQTLAEAFVNVSKNTEVSIQPAKMKHDRLCRAGNFEEGDYVWVLDTATLKGVSKKLSNRFKGPYKISTKVDDATYKVKALKGSRTTMVNKARLKKCFERQVLTDNKGDTLELLNANNKSNMSIPGIDKPAVTFSDEIEIIDENTTTTDVNIKHINQNQNKNSNKNYSAKKPRDDIIEKTKSGAPKKIRGKPITIEKKNTSYTELIEQRPKRTKKKPERLQA